MLYIKAKNAVSSVKSVLQTGNEEERSGIALDDINEFTNKNMRHTANGNDREEDATERRAPTRTFFLRRKNTRTRRWCAPTCTTSSHARIHAPMTSCEPHLVGCCKRASVSRCLNTLIAVLTTSHYPMPVIHIA